MPHLFGFILGFAVLLVTHCLFLDRVPGWQYDEAWAAAFSNEIATVSDFYPLQAISSYTGTWSYYFIALVFKLLGAQLLTYRFCGIFFVVVGVALISRALHIVGKGRAAALFPGLVAFFPALVMNHRWVIEMNTFFVLCWGVFCLGLALRIKKGPKFWPYFFIGVGVVFGTMSHILFLGPVLAVWFWLWVQGKMQNRSDRVAVAAILGLLLPFCLLILKTEPDRARSLPLFALVLGVFVVQWIRLPWIEKNRKWGRGILAVPAALGCIFLIPFFLWIEGTWTILFSLGTVEVPYLVGTFFIPWFLLIFFLFSSKKLKSSWIDFSFFPICLLLTNLMLVKPGPRYFEVPFLICATAFAVGLASLKREQLRTVFSLWVVLGGLHLSYNYFAPFLQGREITRSFRFWIFHTSSGDFISKNNLVKRLVKEGCRFSDLDIKDLRLKEALKFLAIGDWPVPAGQVCRLGTPLRVEVKNGELPHVLPDEVLYEEGRYALIASRAQSKAKQ